MEQLNINNINIIENKDNIDILTNIEEDEHNNLSINKSIENSINLDLDLDLDKNEQIIELPIKKKKGRKSKKIKQLELEQEKQVEPVRRFPKLSEKIFDVLKINEIEYFYDKDFNLLLDLDVIPVGFKYDKKFVFYSETIDNINMIKKDDKEVQNLKEFFAQSYSK
jgi:hypothetical protein